MKYIVVIDEAKFYVYSTLGYPDTPAGTVAADVCIFKSDNRAEFLNFMSKLDPQS